MEKDTGLRILSDEEVDAYVKEVRSCALQTCVERVLAWVGLHDHTCSAGFGPLLL